MTITTQIFVIFLITIPKPNKLFKLQAVPNLAEKNIGNQKKNIKEFHKLINIQKSFGSDETIDKSMPDIYLKNNEISDIFVPIKIDKNPNNVVDNTDDINNVEQNFIESYGDTNIIENKINLKIQKNKTQKNDNMTKKYGIQNKINQSKQMISDTNETSKSIENESLMDIRDITKKITQKSKKSQQYIKDHKHDIIIDLINYLIIIIDFMNRLIYQTFNLIQDKIIGNGNNLFNDVKSYYDALIIFFIKKVSDKTIDILDGASDNKNLLTMWSKYKKKSNLQEKETILSSYLKQYNIKIDKDKYKHISLHEIIELLKDENKI